MITQEQAQQLFEAGGVVVLPLAQHSEFGVDGVLWETAAFGGLKFVPPGLHCFVWSAQSTPVEARTALLIFTDKGQVVTPAHAPNVVHSKKRKYQSEYLTAISKDQLRSIDPQLAPYPFTALDAWKALSSHITQSTLDTVCPSDPDSGYHYVDSLMPSLQEEQEATSHQSQPEAPTLAFACVDPKKSWTEGATGEQRSLEARDKSYLLNRLLLSVGGWTQLLAQLQLAFILFTQLQSYSALEVYTRIITLICSPSLSNQPQQRHDSFLHAITAQFRYIRPEFFSQDAPDLEVPLSQSLHNLALLPKVVTTQSWQSLADLCNSKFGWALPTKPPAKSAYNLLQNDTNQEPDDGYEEVGEDAPVIVEM